MVPGSFLERSNCLVENLVSYVLSYSLKMYLCQRIFLCSLVPFVCLLFGLVCFFLLCKPGLMVTTCVWWMGSWKTYLELDTLWFILGWQERICIYVPQFPPCSTWEPLRCLWVWAKSLHWTNGGPCLSCLSGGLKEDFVSFLCSRHQSKGLQGALLQAALQFSENFRAFPFLSQ